MRQLARFAIDERTTTYDERLEKHVTGYAQDSRGPPVMAAPTAGGAFYGVLRRSNSSSNSRYGVSGGLC